MPISAQLADLRPRLQAAGMIVVEEPDYLSVRLAFFCSVRVYSDGERLRFDTFFGVVPRARSTMLKLGGISVLAVASAHYGIGYAGGVALLAVISAIYDSIRWQVTEHAITRVTMIAALANAEQSTQRLSGSRASQMLGTAGVGVPVAGERTFVRERRDD